MLDLSVSPRDIFGKSYFAKLFLLYWIFVFMLLSNLYKGIVVENMVTPKKFEYPVKFDDLKTSGFEIFTTHSYLLGIYEYKSPFQAYLDEYDRSSKCPYVSNVSADAIDAKVLSTLVMLSKQSKYGDKEILPSNFEKTMLAVYTKNTQPLYEEFMKNKMKFEQVEIEGQNYISDYLYRHTKSSEYDHLIGVFDEIMNCNQTVFVSEIEELLEIKRRMPARSVKTGYEFYTSKTHGYEHDLKYVLEATGYASSEGKVPRNFKSYFESGIFNVWRKFILELKFRNLRVQTRR